MSDLREIIKLLYRMTAEEQRETAAEILDERKAVYGAEMRELIRQVGCDRPPRPPSRESLVTLRQRSDEDVASIAQTWDREMETEVDRLYVVNPRGNRYYYYHHLERWAAARRVWKDQQISSMTVGFARDLARQDFVFFNGLALLGATYHLGGPAPKCVDCVELMARGEVEERVVNQNPMPLHVNCWHQWVLTALPRRVVCEELWVG